MRAASYVDMSFFFVYPHQLVIDWICSDDQREEFDLPWSVLSPARPSCVACKRWQSLDALKNSQSIVIALLATIEKEGDPDPLVLFIPTCNLLLYLYMQVIGIDLAMESIPSFIEVSLQTLHQRKRFVALRKLHGCRKQEKLCKKMPNINM